MKIKEMLGQHRRDFRAIYECEHCGYTEESSGYDDDNFHINVIPKMECSECDKISPIDYIPKKTKYPADLVI